MFSKKLNDFVFIDFGFTHVLKEEVGFKTKTKFFGNFEYCSPEMKTFASKKSKRAEFIDLYYNDAFGIDKSIN